MIASTTEYINSAGAVAAPIAPSLRGVSTQMARQYDVPATLAQTNVGGTLPKIDNELKKVREKRTGGDQEEFSGQEKQLLETTDEDNFAEKLLKMIDPDEKFLSILKNINNRNPLLPPEDYDGTGIDGDLEGNIVNPMEGGVMEDYPGAKFGASRDGGKRKHKGRDLVGPPGMKVVSALPGTVTGIIDVGKLPGGGWSKGIYVKHSNGMETRYLHVHPSVKVGDQVKAGQQIAKITAMDDISSVPHLHFEVIVNGRHVDPEPIVRGSLKMSDIAAGKVPGLSVKAPKNPAEIENHSGTEVSDKTPPASPPSSMATSRQVSSASKVEEQLTAQITESDVNMDGMVAAVYGEGFPKTPTWMKILEQDYQKNKNKPLNPGTPKPGRGMGDVWNPLASADRGSQIASLSRYEQESETNMVLVNNQSSPTTAMPSSGGIEFIQMSGSSSSELLKNLMLQRLNA
jgi:murein DD-endopeptidase MepM/ murein hydrolase activator NlpD